MKIFKYGGHGIDCKIHMVMTTESLYWDSGGNSYVVVESSEHHTKWFHKYGGGFTTQDGTIVQLMSINGIGEIRWEVDRSMFRYDERAQAAARHFHLIFHDFKED